jgi:eukaryotic-like serine/threonine-protein kinase
MNAPPTSDPWIGRSVGDRQRYRIDKRLGGGGMGDVFLAMDTLLGQQVALKLLKETLVVSEELRKRFEREVALCAALRSDHIVHVSDYGVTDEKHPFYVMEYLRGQSLGQLLRREKRLPVERTGSIIMQVCEGLRLAHQGVTLWRDGATASEHTKIVHRDLKPDNIFLVPTALGELVKILDFGIAKIRDDQAEHTSLTNVFLGTFHYAAPEQLEVEKDLDERADIYSLGIILYEMLSGTDAFGLGLNTHNISGVSWAMAHTSKPPQPLRSQPGCEQLPPELEEIVLRCLQKVPDQRFASVTELSGALKAAIAPKTRDTTIAQPTPIQQKISNTTFEQQQTPPPESAQETIFRPIPPPTNVGSFPERVDSGTQYSAPLASTTIDEPKELPSTQHDRKSLLLLAGVSAAVAISISGGAYAFLRWQSGGVPSLDIIRSLQAETNYTECMSKAEAVAQDSSLYKDAQKLLNGCRMEQAKELAVGNKFADAITVASKIPKTSSQYSAAQKLTDQWSNRTLTQATAQFQVGNLDSAIAQAQVIPETSSVHPKAQAAIARWKKDWKVAETQYNTAKEAHEQSKWQVAVDASNKIPDIAFWKKKTKPIVQKAQSEIAKVQPVVVSPTSDGVDDLGAGGAGSAPKYNRPAPRYNRPAPRYNRPAPKYNRPAPKYNPPAPKYNRPAPKYNRPAPKYNPPAPKYNRPAPADNGLGENDSPGDSPI